VSRGTATGNLVAGENINVVITGHIGRKAAQVLIEAGVKIYTGASGKVKNALEDLKTGNLEQMTTVPEKE
jgi:predicted Fe-Mo cluster-binding NifX family protein